MAIERYGSRTDAVVKLVLVFFVCILSFSIGIFVGKKFSDSQYQMAKFEPTTESTQRGVASETREGSLTDDEIAKLAEEFVSDEVESEESPAQAASKPTTEKATAEIAAKPVAEKAVAETSKPASQPAIEATPKATESKTAQVPAPAKTVEAAPAQARIPSSLPRQVASSTIGKYTVQVGAFPSQDLATKEAEKLKAAGLSAFFVEAKVKSGESTKTFYRVSVGLFATRKEAETQMAEILASKKVSSALVQQISQQ